MKQTAKNLTFCLLGLALVACNDDNPWGNSEGAGAISVNISSDVNVTDVKATRADELTAPDVSQFSLQLEKSDGTYSKSWSSPDLFPTDQSFPMGDYTITAKYGDLKDEGFNRPCFMGSAAVTVKPGQTSDVQITATLANAMVSIEYTDQFKNYFSAYSSTLHTEGNAYHTILADETDPFFLAPGKVALQVTFIKPNGQGATVQPAEIQMQARHHYHITLDVNNDGAGNAALVVRYDDSLEAEDVIIDLSDELLNSPAPEVSPNGFTSGTEVTVLSGSSALPAAFDIFAAGGIKNAVLTVTDETSSYTLPVGSNNEIDLCAATEAQQSVLASYGIKAIGLYRNPDQMAKVSLTDYIATLPEGKYEISLLVKDQLLRVNNPVPTLNVVVSSIDLSVAALSIYNIGATSAQVTMAYNGENPAEDITFQVQNDNGIWVAAPATCSAPSAAKKRASEVFPTKNYTFTLTVPEMTRDVKLRIYLKGKLKFEETIPCTYPEYTAQADAFANHVVLYISADDAATKSYVAQNARVFVTAASAVSPTMTRDTSAGTITIKGLTPETQYTIETSLSAGDNPTILTTGTATTEAAAAVPNGDFESLTAQFSVSGQKQGGEFKRTKIATVSGQNTQGFSLSEPTSWATSNATTYNRSSSNDNSWFRVLSAYNSGLNFVSTMATVAGMGGQTSTPAVYQVAAQSGSNAMAIRNVAYSAAGTTPSTYSWTAAVPDSYYNPTVPTISDRAAGRLYLGTTSEEGVSFASRPSSLSLYYKYAQDSQDTSETGTVTVQLLNGDTVIATGSANLGAQASYTQVTVPLAYSKTFTKATKLKISFSSSNRAAANIKTTSRAELYLQESYGAVLTVDNLTFNY